jgi:WD40 repeat protein
VTKINEDDVLECLSFQFVFFPPNTGIYVTSGSSSNGYVFIWNAMNGKLVQKLEGAHESGVCSVAWGRRLTCDQQVASVDKTGKLVLWM